MRNGSEAAAGVGDRIHLGLLCSYYKGGGGGTAIPGQTRKRHIPPHPAQPRHTNHWAPRTRKRHQREHRPQRPTERSDPTQHAKGRTGDRPGPRKGTTTRRNVTRGVLQFQGFQGLTLLPSLVPTLDAVGARCARGGGIPFLIHCDLRLHSAGRAAAVLSPRHALPSVAPATPRCCLDRRPWGSRLRDHAAVRPVAVGRRGWGMPCEGAGSAHTRLRWRRQGPPGALGRGGT